MKQKQQVISRFFAPKAAPEPSSNPFPASRLSPSTAVQWPPARTSASLRNLQRGSSQSPTRKSLEEASPGHRKRPSSPDSPGVFGEGGEENDPEPVDLDRPEICSGAISLGGERDQRYVHDIAQNAGTSESNEPRSTTVSCTYKRRRKKESTAEEYPKLGFLGEEDPLSTLTENGSQKPNTGEPTSVSTYWKSKESLEIPASDPARHKKFVEKLLTSTDPEGPLQASRPSKVSSKEQYTPLEQQVVELKAKYKDVLLMVEVGYRYRMFGEDAETAARVLGIFAYNDHNFMTAGIPSFRLHVHVRRLVEAGYKVGVVRQTETAAIKAHGGNKVGPFTRSLSALYSRATLEAAADLGGGEPSTERGGSSNYLMCIAEQVDTLKSSAKGPVRKQGASDKGEADTEAMSKGAYDTTIGVIAVETATGDVMYGQFKDSVMRTELEAHLLTCSPTELLLASPLASSTEKLLLDFAGPSSNVRIERVPCDTLENGAAIGEVLGFYGSNESTDFNHEKCEVEEKFDEGLEAIMAMPELVIQALALALRHLKQFGLERVLRLGATFRPFARVFEMSLSSNTLQQLEILQSNADGTTKGSLLWLMDHTHTAFGARLFQHWLTHPLRDQALISARLDAVCEIVDSMGSVGGSQSEGSFPGSGRGGGFIGASSRGCTDGLTKGSRGSLGAVLMALKKIPDVERGITRIFHGTATASEFVAVIQALLTAVKQLQQIHLEDEDETEPHVEKLRTFSSPLLKRLFAAASSSVVSEHALRLLSFLNKEAASTGDKHNLFICGTGKFPMVEKCKAAVKAAEQHLDSLLPQYRKLLKTPNLQYMSVSGSTHLIEVPVAQHVPPDWVKICSTKKTNRYHSPEVLQALDVLTLAKEELTVECNKAWDSFLVAFASYYVDFRAMVHALATLDCLYSLAIVSRNQGYTRPNFVQESSVQLIIEGGRHPVLEAILQEGFVPNDTHLHADHEHCQIITGPNMGGKSCYIRQVALIAIMAQVGSYVPAVSAKLHAFDAIYTRMGASDSLQRGSSTFLEELGEASTILRRATPYSLVIMDELGRGTSTHDGVAIAYATLEYLLKDIRCLTLFVTHYPKLAELRERFPGEIGAYHVSYLAEASSDPLVGSEVACKQSPENDDCDSAVLKECHGQNVASEAAHKITFLYKLVQGVASRSFGLHVARLAQIPEACILKASTMAAKLENEVRSRACPLKRNGVSEKPHVESKDGLQGAYTSVCNNSCNELQATEDHAEENNDLSLTNNVHVLKGKECLEGSEGSVNGMSVAEVSELLSSVFSALKSPEEAFSALKTLQERTALSFRV